MFTAAIYKNGDCKLVRVDHLNSLIFTGEINQFLRLKGWVTIGCDPIRIKGYGRSQKERRYYSNRILTET
jgi:hypothetical protein